MAKLQKINILIIIIASLVVLLLVSKYWHQYLAIREAAGAMFGNM